MGLLDEIRQEHVKNNRARCTVARLVEVMEDEERADFLAAIDDHALSCAAIARAVTARGHDIQQGTLTRHRKGMCGCPRG